MPEMMTLLVNGVRVTVPAGSMVSTAVAATGATWFRQSVAGEPRGPLCGMGICYECRVTIDDQPHSRSCQVPCQPGMEVRTNESPEPRPPAGLSLEQEKSPLKGNAPTFRHDCDVLIIGGGPAGLAAASCAAESTQRVIIVDDNPSLGGQIWRGEERNQTAPEAAAWFEKARSANVELMSGATVITEPVPGLLVAESFEGTHRIGYRKLILATGARERFLPFPGWTLPNVMGAGGLQALVKSGLPITGKKVVVAGSGPLLLAVAAYLRKCGADVLLIAEQASWRRVGSFGLELLKQPAKIFQAIGLKRQFAGVPYLTSCWPVEAHGREKLESVTLRQGDKTWQVACDSLACGFHLVPNLELALLLGCDVQDGRVRVDEFQETSMPEVYCAGESTGIGGLELSLVEGRIAGYAAVGKLGEAQKLFAARERLQRFADSLNRAFALRDELKSLPQPDTIVCRCEDVTFERLRACSSWREAKLQTRCGMGPCQGRVCGAALEFLLDWNPESVRPPVFPARVESLMQQGA